MTEFNKLEVVRGRQ